MRNITKKSCNLLVRTHLPAESRQRLGLQREHGADLKMSDGAKAQDDPGGGKKDQDTRDLNGQWGGPKVDIAKRD